MRLDPDFPKVSLMVITDGRWDYLRQTLASAREHLGNQFSYGSIVVNDSGDPFPDDIDLSWPGKDRDLWVVDREGSQRRGLAGAIQAGWDELNEVPLVDYVFHLEDDFTFPQPVPIPQMLSALRAYPSLAQVALKRQPWSPEEQLARNMLLLKPGLYEQDGLCIHEHLFTFNPCIYPREITRYGAGLERELTDKLVADGWKFAYYGGKHDDPRCIHIGHRRSAGYRW